MPPTRVTNVIVPEVFAPYVTQLSTEKFALLMGGAVNPAPEFDVLATTGGKTINMPFWNDLDIATYPDEVLSDTTPLGVDPIIAGQDVAVLLGRGKAFGGNDLAAAFAGSDPVEVIAQRFADYRSRAMQASLINILAGVIADNVANDSGDMVNDIAVEAIASQTDETVMGTNAVIDAITGTMGDAWEKIVAMSMHSAMFARLQKQDQIVYVDVAGNVVGLSQGQGPASAGALIIPTYLGRRVIVDDSMPVVAGSTDGFKYTTYLYGNGAVALGNGQPKYPAEVDRDSLQGDDLVINRWHIVLHPRGIAWQDTTVTGATPSNANLALATNWDRVYDRKNVRLAALVTN